MRSAFASGSRRPALGVALALCAASCSKLDVSPGGDFGVRILDPTPIQAVGRISVPIRFAVDGCETFRVAVGTSGTSHAMEVVRDGDAWVADVPVDWLRAEDGECLRGAERAVSSAARLDVTCSDAGRTASASFDLSYATADVVLHAWMGTFGGVIEYLYPRDDPFRPYALAPTREPYAPLIWSYSNSFGAVPMWMDWASYERDPLDRPRVVEGEQAVFVTSGCYERSSCAALEVAPGVLAPSEEIFAGGLPGSLDVFGPVDVPGHVTDIGVLPTGELLVVSHFSTSEVADGQYAPPHDTVISRLTLIPGGQVIGQPPIPAGTVQIIAYLPDEVVTTRLSRMADGRFAFVSHLNPDPRLMLTAFLDVTDGFTLERTPDVTGGDPVTEWIVPSLSPDGSMMEFGNRIGPIGATTWNRLPADEYYLERQESGGASWGPDAIALWEGEPVGEVSAIDVGRVEAFDLAPPHARLFRHDVAALSGSSMHATLHGVAVVGDHFVLTTNTGVRVLDRAGNVVGGADPLPCRMSPTAVAIASGPAQAAVATAEDVLVFDLSKL